MLPSVTGKHNRTAALLFLCCCAAFGLFVACGNSPAAPAPSAGNDAGSSLRSSPRPTSSRDASPPGDARELAIENAIRGSCDVTAPTTCPTPSPHYSDIAPIVQRDCVPCHSGATPDGPWPLTGYKQLADWAGVIQDDLGNCTMPPLDGGVPITAADRLAILVWLQCGAPE